jgi:enamine deaminase RidA (YjgF/YER057c/UK114 family)
MDIKRYKPGPILSEAVEYNRTVYLAGMVAPDTSQDIKGQTRQVLKEIDDALAAADTHKSRILSCNVWLADIRLREQMNEVWGEWLDKGNPPARATVEAKMADPRVLVEIMVVAAK